MTYCGTVRVQYCGWDIPVRARVSDNLEAADLQLAESAKRCRRSQSLAGALWASGHQHAAAETSTLRSGEDSGDIVWGCGRRVPLNACLHCKRTAYATGTFCHSAATCRRSRS